MGVKKRKKRRQKKKTIKYSTYWIIYEMTSNSIKSI